MNPDRAAYGAMTGRNLGFVTPAEQEVLRTGRVFVCGVGGMGGAALVTLVRAGVGELCVADPDQFEASNLNRQLLATRDTLGCAKTEVARQYVARVNPEARVSIMAIARVERLAVASCVAGSGISKSVIARAGPQLRSPSGGYFVAATRRRASALELIIGAITASAPKSRQRLASAKSSTASRTIAGLPASATPPIERMTEPASCKPC